LEAVSAVSGQVPSFHTHCALHVLGAASRASALLAAMHAFPQKPQAVLEMHSPHVVSFWQSSAVTFGPTGLMRWSQLVIAIAQASNKDEQM
jgi:hypothetical protein